MKLKFVVLLLVFCLSSVSGVAQWGRLLKDLGLDEQEEISEEKAALGLKEALRVGAEKAVERTGRIDGYLKNEVIKILLPEPLRKTERVLRFAGFGPDLDELVVSMNRAAEKAAPHAKDIFWKAIQEMTFSDALGILKGGDRSATDYFQEKTSPRLRELFYPVVEESMKEVGVTREFNGLMERVNAFQFIDREDVDINNYVVGKALDGLFHVLGEEERAIRNNPAARVTDLLKDVFGNL